VFGEKFLQTSTMSDKQGMEICESVSRLLVEELDTEDTRKRVKQMLTTYLKENNINEDAANLVDNFEWSVKVSLKNKQAPQLGVNTFSDDKKKGQFTVEQRKNKREIIEEGGHRVDISSELEEDKAKKEALEQTGDDHTSGW
jgi:hypothetical protein